MASKSNVTGKELGESGVSFYSGQISGEEYNHDLLGKRGLAIYDQMRRGDATVKASLKAIKLPIKSAEYRVDQASDDPTDVAARELADYCLFELVDWKKFLGEALTHLEFGFAVFEMVFEPRYVDGNLRVALVKLGFRKQLSIYAWETIDKQQGITQWLANGKRISIPVERLVHIANEQEGDNYQGNSLLRPAYKNWKFKEKFYLIDAIGAENQALGVVDIVEPASATTDQKNNMKAWARNRRANEIGYIMHPENWTVSYMDMKAKSLKDMEPSIKHHDNQILKNVLAQFVGLETGSRALSEDHSRLFILSIKEVVDNMIFAIQRTAIKTLVDLNFTVSEYPKLAVGNISDENIPEVTAGIKVAVEAGILHPASADENVVRKMLGLPEKAIKELDELFAKSDSKPSGDAVDQKANVVDLKAMRASIERKLFANPTQRSVQAQVSARDFPGLYEGTGVNPDDLGCIMADVEPFDVTGTVGDDLLDDLVDESSRHDHVMGAVGELEPHVTLLYGLLENGNTWKDKVDTVLDGWNLDSITVSEVGFFETPDSYAVVAHVETTPELIDGHERLTLLPHIQTFSEYKPHITLAYVDRGADVEEWVAALGEKYNGSTVKVTGLNYGDLPDEKAA